MLRRTLAAVVTGLLATAGPATAPALAASAQSAGPAITLSVTSVRPGLVFSATGASGCPSASGTQLVSFTFTDSAGAEHELGSTQTQDDGSWTPARLAVPVAGIDPDGGWSAGAVPAGAGSVQAECLAADSADPGDDSGDDVASADAEAPTSTQTYATAALSVSGAAGTLSLSTALVVPGGTLSVTPAEPCPGAGTVSVALTPLSTPDDSGDGSDPGDPSNPADSGDSGNPGDPGDSGDAGDSGDSGDPGDSGAVASVSAATSSNGTWTPLTLSVPAGAETGDYAVSADCAVDGVTTSSYDGKPVAVGTVRIGAPSCGTEVISAPLTGSYTGDLAGVSPIRARAAAAGAAPTLPIRIRLSGLGPWQVKVRSATTGQQLAARTLTCPARHYELDVTRSGLSEGNRLQVRVCNTGNASADAVLQIKHGRRYQDADSETLDAGECTWLTGEQVTRNSTLTARVLIDPPGRGSDPVETVKVHRGRR